MDIDLQQLAAVEQEIEELVKKQTRLQKKDHKGTITDEEAIELVGIDKLLADARDSAKRYFELIKLSMKQEPPQSKSFSEADSEWTQSVTGVNTRYRKWTSYLMNPAIEPRHGFKKAFEEISTCVYQLTKAGRRYFLNLFLLDIIHCPEFEGTLRLFPQLELSVTDTNGTKKRKLNGRTDYTIGFGKGKDITSESIHREVHVVAVEAKTSFGDQDLRQFIAQAATLFKIRVDVGNEKIVSGESFKMLNYGTSFSSMKNGWCGKLVHLICTFVLMRAGCWSSDIFPGYKKFDRTILCRSFLFSKMETPSTSTSSPTTIESSTYSIHDPPGYIKPSLQDMLLTDITAEELLKIAERLGVDYLGPALTFPVSFRCREKYINQTNVSWSTSHAADVERTYKLSMPSFLSTLALQLRTYRPRPWKH